MGIQFGTLWGGTNGDMLAGMYGDNGEDMEAESNNISEASNDSSSNQVLMAS